MRKLLQVLLKHGGVVYELGRLLTELGRAIRPRKPYYRNPWRGQNSPWRN